MCITMNLDYSLRSHTAVLAGAAGGACARMFQFQDFYHVFYTRACAESRLDFLHVNSCVIFYTH